MATGDIYYVNVLFSDGSEAKSRYTVEIGHNRLKTVLLDSITSKYDKKSSFIKLQYYPIIDWREAGLKKQSYIDIHSYFEEEKSKVLPYQTGRLTNRDLKNLTKFIGNYEIRLREFRRSTE